MRTGLLGCLLLVLAGDAFAHRLDEYLQAMRVSVATNRIDVDRTGHISEDEGNAYAQSVLRDIRVGLDEKPLSLHVESTSFPALHEIKSGLGVIRIKATAFVEPLAAGRHTLSLTNAHLPVISVYLVNALVPKDHSVQITKQTRDELQKHYRLEFGVNRASR